MPTTKAGVTLRAQSEGWPFTEQKGVGGTRRMYEIPDFYLGKEGATAPESKPQAVTRTIQQSNTSPIDTEMLRLATEALEEWLEEKSVRLDPKRKAAVIAVLYDYLAKGADRDDMLRMLKAMAA